MHLHLVTTHMHPGGPHRALREERAGCTLMSYAHRRVEPFLRGCWGPGHRLIIDSGAFTAWTAGEAIRPEVYAEWALQFEQRWRGRLGALEFMNLDVIGDQEASWRNLQALRVRGLDAMPVVTHGAEPVHLERAIEEHPRLALGGLVPLTRNPAALRAWLDRCFGLLLRRHAAGQRLVRVHLLGVTQPWVLRRYPAFSADSSSWEISVRYGGASGQLGVPHPKVPRNAAQPALNLYVLRQQVRAAQALAQEVSAIWAARGITWTPT